MHLIAMHGLGEAQRLDGVFELLEKLEVGTTPGCVELINFHLNTLVNVSSHAGKNDAQLS